MLKSGEKLFEVLAKDKSCIVLLHNTDTLSKAKGILINGFKFENQLTYSTDRVNPRDIIEINYFLVERKEYGDYTIIIEINKEILNQYSRLAETSDLTFEEIISTEKPELSDNDEFVYTLSHYYIKGIFNNKTGEMLVNPVFDAAYDSPHYLENFNMLNK
ncbi:MAG: hypothetical protein QNK33_01990 [Bacteroidales bacterium]|nr:hypothetical protein [Bacteroidales bacterium]